MYFCGVFINRPKSVKTEWLWDTFYSVDMHRLVAERFMLLTEKENFCFFVLHRQENREALLRHLKEMPLFRNVKESEWLEHQAAPEAFLRGGLDISFSGGIESRLQILRQSLLRAEQYKACGPYVHNLYLRIFWLYENIRREFDYNKIPANPAKALDRLIGKIYHPDTRLSAALVGDVTAMYPLIGDVFLKRISEVRAFESPAFPYRPTRAVEHPRQLKADVYIAGKGVDISVVVSHILNHAQQTRLPVLLVCADRAWQRQTEHESNVFCYTVDDLNTIVRGYEKERALLIRQIRKRIREETGRFDEWARSNRPNNFAGIISADTTMYRIFETIVRVAPNDITVLIEGSSGTGKELIARAIHEMSARRDRPFVTVNCSAIPDTLLESELFGHVKGAFTGAVTHKNGLFQEANHGTIFLDEIGELSEALQVKLLRFLQNGEIRPVGGAQTQFMDVRLITATNRNLLKRVREGQYRGDFYYRINVVRVTLPDLKQRGQDIPLLIHHFITRFAAKFHKEIHGMHDDALEILKRHAWPGNIRELENVIEHACAMCIGTMIMPEDLPPLEDNRPTSGMTEMKTLKELEKEHLLKALRVYDNNYDAIARVLGISRTTLWRKLKELNLS
ncbi:MAG: AAA family ATPase [Calditrichaeota bacterium]|nr:MAG: AAA family ATPase [Calditrichota bacterium]